MKSKIGNKTKIYSRKCNYAITFSGKRILNFSINLTLYFFINFILTFTSYKKIEENLLYDILNYKPKTDI